ncbi:MAG: hypothetical protein VXY09_04660 [Bacteroidota bacterium]|nr:hypothetical protein [Bacteroidota bacterium]
MKKQKLIVTVCAVLLCILMIASDYHGYTTEMAVIEFKGEVFDKSFTPSLGSFIVPLSILAIAFLPNQKK